jgi:hypothetical protein
VDFRTAGRKRLSVSLAEQDKEGTVAGVRKMPEM